MIKENINLAQLNISQGEIISNEDGLTIKPDNDGFIRLRLDGDTAFMGGIEWTDEKYLIIDMLADMDAMTTVDILFFKDRNSDENDKNVLNYHMIPTKRVKMVVKLDELESKRNFLPTLPGTLKGHVRGKPTNISNINAIELYIHPGYSNIFKSFTIYEMYLSDEIPDMTVIGEPMVDEMGQWIQKDWNTKVHSVEDMVLYLKQEYKRAETDNQYPEGWNRFGGYKNIKFDATGFFHTHYDGKRWWLVDPEGYAFFSNGMCYGSRMGVHGFVDKMENLFSWLPEKDDPVFKDAWTTADQIPEFVKRNGVEAGKGRYMFNFARANMIRAFGADGWWDAWVKINSARLKRWGFNTIGVGVNNYYDERVMEYLEKAEIPFVWTLKEFPLTKSLIFRDFPDVFSDEFAENSRIFAEKQLSPFVGNPYMIGYFVNNEPEWKFQSSVNLAERVFAHKERLASKDILIQILKNKYRTIEALNKAWNKDFKGFDDLYTPFENADAFTEQSKKDMNKLREILLKKYASVTGEALRKVDPDHLNLGMRFGGISKNEVPGTEYYDVLSFNYYGKTVVPHLDEVSSIMDVPTIIGEWHIGGGDKGLLSHGLLSSPTQEERGKACEYYMQGAMAHKNCVGIHYFEMNDQPLLGRFDGECMQHGVIDVCNRPYDELIRHFINTNHRLYDYVLGNIEPNDVEGVIRYNR